MTSELSVYFENFLVGVVSVNSQLDISFRYSKRWLATKHHFPISVTMPLDEVGFPDAIVHPWLSNLLPEESQLSRVAKTLRLSSQDVIRILEEIGGDTVGALTFGKPSDTAQRKYETLNSFYKTNDSLDALEQHFSEIDSRPFLAGYNGIRISVAGGQKKTALTVIDALGHPVYRLPTKSDSLAINKSGAPSTLLVKPDNPHLLGMIENEVWCLKLAKSVGIDSAEATIIGEDTTKALAILRFDRKYGENGRIQRIHQEDFAQANGIYPFQKYEHVKPNRGLFGLSAKDLLSTIRHCRTGEAFALIDQFIFNILVANSDAHAKNYSLIFEDSSVPRLAPIYDVLTMLNWKHISKTYAQKIAGRTRTNTKIAGRHWKQFAKESGFRPTEVLGRVEELTDLILKNSAIVSEHIVTMSGALEAYVDQTASAVEKNVDRIRGKLHL